MYKIINKEKGYALIIVLLVIVIIAIMTPPIISRIMSSSSQFQLVEVDLQLEKLEKMGEQYSEEATDAALKKTQSSVQGWIDNEILMKRRPSINDVIAKFRSVFSTEILQYVKNPTEVSVMEPNFIYKVRLESLDVTSTLLTIDFSIESLVINHETKSVVYNVKRDISIIY